jgi:hypothetical protein
LACQASPGIGTIEYTADCSLKNTDSNFVDVRSFRLSFAPVVANQVRAGISCQEQAPYLPTFSAN